MDISKVVPGITLAILKGSERRNYLGRSRYRTTYTIYGVMTPERWARLYPDNPPKEEAFIDTNMGMITISQVYFVRVTQTDGQRNTNDRIRSQQTKTRIVTAANNKENK